MIQQCITDCVDLELCNVSLPIEHEEGKKKERIVNAIAHRVRKCTCRQGITDAIFDQATKSLPHRDTLTPESVGGKFFKVGWLHTERTTKGYKLAKWKVIMDGVRFLTLKEKVQSQKKKARVRVTGCKRHREKKIKSATSVKIQLPLLGLGYFL